MEREEFEELIKALNELLEIPAFLLFASYKMSGISQHEQTLVFSELAPGAIPRDMYAGLLTLLQAPQDASNWSWVSTYLIRRGGERYTAMIEDFINSVRNSIQMKEGIPSMAQTVLQTERVVKSGKSSAIRNGRLPPLAQAAALWMTQNLTTLQQAQQNAPKALDVVSVDAHIDFAPHDPLNPLLQIVQTASVQASLLEEVKSSSHLVPTPPVRTWASSVPKQPLATASPPTPLTAESHLRTVLQVPKVSISAPPPLQAMADTKSVVPKSGPKNPQYNSSHQAALKVMEARNRARSAFVPAAQTIHQQAPAVPDVSHLREQVTVPAVAELSIPTLTRRQKQEIADAAMSRRHALLQAGEDVLDHDPGIALERFGHHAGFQPEKSLYGQLAENELIQDHEVQGLAERMLGPGYQRAQISLVDEEKLEKAERMVANAQKIFDLMRQFTGTKQTEYEGSDLLGAWKVLKEEEDTLILLRARLLDTNAETFVTEDLTKLRALERRQLEAEINLITEHKARQVTGFVLNGVEGHVAKRHKAAVALTGAPDQLEAELKLEVERLEHQQSEKGGLLRTLATASSSHNYHQGQLLEQEHWVRGQELKEQQALLKTHGEAAVLFINGLRTAQSTRKKLALSTKTQELASVEVQESLDAAIALLHVNDLQLSHRAPNLANLFSQERQAAAAHVHWALELQKLNEELTVLQEYLHSHQFDAEQDRAPFQAQRAKLEQRKIELLRLSKGRDLNASVMAELEDGALKSAQEHQAKAEQLIQDRKIFPQLRHEAEARLLQLKNTLENTKDQSKRRLIEDQIDEFQGKMFAKAMDYVHGNEAQTVKDALAPVDKARREKLLQKREIQDATAKSAQLDKLTKADFRYKQYDLEQREEKYMARPTSSQVAKLVHELELEAHAHAVESRKMQMIKARSTVESAILDQSKADNQEQRLVLGKLRDWIQREPTQANLIGKVREQYTKLYNSSEGFTRRNMSIDATTRKEWHTLLSSTHPTLKDAEAGSPLADMRTKVIQFIQDTDRLEQQENDIKTRKLQVTEAAKKAPQELKQTLASKRELKQTLSDLDFDLRVVQAKRSSRDPNGVHAQEQERLIRTLQKQENEKRQHLNTMTDMQHKHEAFLILEPKEQKRLSALYAQKTRDTWDAQETLTARRLELAQTLTHNKEMLAAEDKSMRTVGKKALTDLQKVAFAPGYLNRKATIERDELELRLLNPGVSSDPIAAQVLMHDLQKYATTYTELVDKDGTERFKQDMKTLKEKMIQELLEKPLGSEGARSVSDAAVQLHLQETAQAKEKREARRVRLEVLDGLGLTFQAQYTHSLERMQHASSDGDDPTDADQAQYISKFAEAWKRLLDINKEHFILTHEDRHGDIGAKVAAEMMHHAEGERYKLYNEYQKQAEALVRKSITNTLTSAEIEVLSKHGTSLADMVENERSYTEKLEMMAEIGEVQEVLEVLEEKAGDTTFRERLNPQTADHLASLHEKIDMLGDKFRLLETLETSERPAYEKFVSMLAEMQKMQSDSLAASKTERENLWYQSVAANMREKLMESPLTDKLTAFTNEPQMMKAMQEVFQALASQEKSLKAKEDAVALQENKLHIAQNLHNDTSASVLASLTEKADPERYIAPLMEKLREEIKETLAEAKLRYRFHDTPDQGTGVVAAFKSVANQWHKENEPSALELTRVQGLELREDLSSEKPILTPDIVHSITNPSTRATAADTKTDTTEGDALLTQRSSELKKQDYLEAKPFRDAAKQDGKAMNEQATALTSEQEKERQAMLKEQRNQARLDDRAMKVIKLPKGELQPIPVEPEVNPLGQGENAVPESMEMSHAPQEGGGQMLTTDNDDEDAGGEAPSEATQHLNATAQLHKPNVPFHDDLVRAAVAEKDLEKERNWLTRILNSRSSITDNEVSGNSMVRMIKAFDTNGQNHFMAYANSEANTFFNAQDAATVGEQLRLEELEILRDCMVEDNSENGALISVLRKELADRTVSDEHRSVAGNAAALLMHSTMPSLLQETYGKYMNTDSSHYYAMLRQTQLPSATLFTIMNDAGLYRTTQAWAFARLQSMILEPEFAKKAYENHYLNTYTHMANGGTDPQGENVKDFMESAAILMAAYPRTMEELEAVTLLVASNRLE